MYQINELATLAGITTRTLRYYDKENLLKPSKVLENGYRVYTSKEVDKLQSILFYKELGYELKEIKSIINNSDFDIISSLNSHLDQLLLKKSKIDKLIDLVMETLEHKERNDTMDDTKKFEAFKEEQLKENEEKYGTELREKYNNDFVNQVNENYKKKSKWEMQKQEELNMELNSQIIQAVSKGDVTSDESIRMCELHKEWIMFYWPTYNKESHLGLVKMYTEDDRFKAYYDKIIEGSAQFLYDAMRHYLSKQK